jgi:hypothetical protein
VAIDHSVIAADRPDCPQGDTLPPLVSSQLEGEPALLVARIQEALRHEALQRWPEARQLQGEAWLAFVDRHGDSNFSQFSPNWSSWLYGSQNPTREQCEQLRQHYRRWGQTLFFQLHPRSGRKAGRRHP